MEETQRVYASHNELYLTETKESALKRTDALVICTNWQSLKALDLIKCKLTPDSEGKTVLIGGRNLFDPKRVKAKGFFIGR